MGLKEFQADLRKFWDQPWRGILTVLVMIAVIIGASFFTSLGSTLSDIFRDYVINLASETPDPASSPSPPVVSESEKKAQCKILILDSDSDERSEAKTEIRNALVDELDERTYNIEPIAPWADWQYGQATKIAEDKPCIIIAHLHTFKTTKAYPTDAAEDTLVKGLAALKTKSPDTHVLIYSSSFYQESEYQPRFAKIIERNKTSEPGREQAYMLLSAAKLFRWPYPSEKPTPDQQKANKDVLVGLVKTELQSAATTSKQ